MRPIQSQRCWRIEIGCSNLGLATYPTTPIVVILDNLLHTFRMFWTRDLFPSIARRSSTIPYLRLIHFSNHPPSTMYRHGSLFAVKGNVSTFSTLGNIQIYTAASTRNRMHHLP